MDDFFYFPVLTERVIIGFEVVAEKQGDGLPEIGVESSLVFPDMGEGGVVGLAVDEADQDFPLGDGEPGERLLEPTHEVRVFFFYDVAAFPFGSDVGKAVLDAVDFPGGELGVGKSPADVVHGAGMQALLAGIVTGRALLGRNGDFRKSENRYGVLLPDDGSCHLLGF